MQPLAPGLTPRFLCSSYTRDSRPCAISGRMIAPHYRPSTAREARARRLHDSLRCGPPLLLRRCTLANGLALRVLRAGNSLLGAEPDDLPKPVQHKMKNFAQAKPNAEFGSYRWQHSTLPDFKFLIFPVLRSHPRFRKEQWPMNNSMSKQTTIHLVDVSERGNDAARIEGGAQSRVTGVNSLATR